MWFINRTYKKIRNCLFRILNRQFLIFLFFLALSAAFWLFQSLEEPYEQEFSIPLRLKNIPENVVITTEPPREIRIMLKDKGTTLLHYRYGRAFSPITINFEDYATSNGQVRFLTADVIKQAYAQLSPATRVESIRPDTIEYYYNYGESKRVPIRIQGEIHADLRYYLSSVRIKPDSVTVYAVRPILDTITAAYTTPVYIKNVTDTMSWKEDLARIRGVKFDPKQINISLAVDQMIEKTVQVPIRGVNFPATKTLRTFPSKVNVAFHVGRSMYKLINSDNFVLVINYEDLIENKSGKCQLSFKTIPTGVFHVRINPKEVDFLIEDVVSEN